MTDTPYVAPQWGYMMLRFCDQGRVAHLLKGDGSPACGAKFYASCGAASEDVPENDKCRRCSNLKIAKLADMRKWFQKQPAEHKHAYDARNLCAVCDYPRPAKRASSPKQLQVLGRARLAAVRTRSVGPQESDDARKGL